MISFYKEIFQSIMEGKWLSIEYRNQQKNVTRYWIAIKSIDVRNKRISCDGFHVITHELAKMRIYLSSILDAQVVEGSYTPRPEALIEDIRQNPDKYSELFGNVANLKILEYLAECNRLDTTPYKSKYALIEKLDNAKLENNMYSLSEKQFSDIVFDFQSRSTKKKKQLHMTIELGMNLLSVNTRKGLYVLVYQPLRLHVVNKVLTAVDDPVVCKEFTIDGEQYSIRQFLDEENMVLLNNYRQNAEIIKDLITERRPELNGVDDMPYILSIGRDFLLDLKSEYNGIIQMYNNQQEKEDIPYPIQAFFGDLLSAIKSKTSYPLALINHQVNLDQLVAINNAMRYPLSYVQGPPGTGKTQTILHTIITAFFNQQSVLFASYNNHPIDGVIEKLFLLDYKGVPIPFPFARLGNNEEVLNTLGRIASTYHEYKDKNIRNVPLEANMKERKKNARALSRFLSDYEEKLDLQERKEAIETLIESSVQMNFQLNLQAEQLNQINQKIKNMPDFSLEEAIRLLDDDTEELARYLYYTSISYYQKLSLSENRDLLDILNMKKGEEKVKEFNTYLSNPENLKKFIAIFPIIATTCISAHKLGDSEPLFDMVMIDEASQCNTAISLVPIIRGKRLMLVGDPQQLSPVILLSPSDNQRLRAKYHVSEEYDYIKNSVYKTFLACDSINDEILLRNHYRCNPRIISFNNQKYYNNRLEILTHSEEKDPLVYINIEDNTSYEKNTSPREVEEIIRYVREHKDQSIGIITPFTNQREAILSSLKENKLEEIDCGTVHAFQGDEKDVILFSLSLSDYTRQETYDWLKNNRELINVATSRARSKLIILGSEKELERLHNHNEKDDLYELVQYVKSNGAYEVTRRISPSRALGIKPYSTKTEEAFLTTLNHALENAFNDGSKYNVYREVAISQVFMDNPSYTDYFYKGRFDFVVYHKENKTEIPVLAIELDGKEHYDDDIVKKRDEKKEQICHEHGFELIRVENSYARRYQYIKDILISYFQSS